MISVLTHTHNGDMSISQLNYQVSSMHYVTNVYCIVKPRTFFMFNLPPTCVTIYA